MSDTTQSGPWLTTPRAILVGALLIGVFCYLGLRDRSDPDGGALSERQSLPNASASGHVPAVEPPSPSAEQPLHSAEPSASVPPPPNPGAVEGLVRRALETHWPAAKAACWKGRPAEARVSLAFRAQFSAEGQQLMRAIQEPRVDETQLAWVHGLGNCLQEHLPPLAIAPPGALVNVEFPLELP